jgi:hypothetical protein
LRKRIRKIFLLSFFRNSKLERVFRNFPIFKFAIKVTKRVNKKINIKTIILFKIICYFVFSLQEFSKIFSDFDRKKALTAFAIKIQTVDYAILQFISK